MDAHPQDTLRRVAVLSDVHGNLPAFEAVVTATEDAGVDARWCLGDLVGYGAQPNECIRLASESCSLSLVGNHDLVVLGKLDVGEFSRNAAIAALWTRDELSDESSDYLSACEPDGQAAEIGLFHASPRDPVWEYVLSGLLASDCMDTMDMRVAAIGHSHVALYFTRVEGEHEASGDPAPDGTERELRDGEWLLNPGAVGQPRDGDPRAAWMELDLEGQTATWHRVEYPIDDAAAAIARAGLPAMLADRLYYGQ